MPETMLTTLLATVALAVSGLILVYRCGSQQKVLGASLFAYCAQLLVVLLIFTNLGLVADDITYHRESLLIAQAHQLGFEPMIRNDLIGRQAFFRVVGYLYFLFGAHPILGLVLVPTLMGLIPAILAYSARNFELDRSVTLSAWLSAALPPFFLWAPWLRREALVFFLLAATVMGISLIYRSRFLTGIGILLFVILALRYTRTQLILDVVAGLAVVLFVVTLRKASSRLSRTLIGVVTLIIIAGGAVLSPKLLALSGTQNLLTPHLDSIVASNSSVAENLRVSGVSGAYNTSPTGFGINLIRSLFGPFPWEWQNLAWIVAGLEGLLLLGATVLIGWALIRVPQSRAPAVILLAALFPLIAGTAYTLANYGIVMRVRAHYYLFLIPIMTAGLTSALGTIRPYVESRLQTRSVEHAEIVSEPD